MALAALFQSLLYEAVGRTINPVNGAVGLLWTGNWHLCQLGVEQVLRGGGGALRPLSQFMGAPHTLTEPSEDCSSHHQVITGSGSRVHKRKVGFDDVKDNYEAQYSAGLLAERVGVGGGRGHHQPKKQRAGTPYEESETTTSGSSAQDYCASQTERKLLTLFF